MVVLDVVVLVVEVVVEVVLVVVLVVVELVLEVVEVEVDEDELDVVAALVVVVAAVVVVRFITLELFPQPYKMEKKRIPKAKLSRLFAFEIIDQPPGIYDLLHKLGERLRGVDFSAGQVFDRPGGQIDFNLVSRFDLLCRFDRFQNWQPDVYSVAVKDPGKGFRDHRRNPGRFNGDRSVFARRTAAEIFSADNKISARHLFYPLGIGVFHAVLSQFGRIRSVKIPGRNNQVGIDIIPKLPSSS